MSIVIYCLKYKRVIALYEEKTLNFIFWRIYHDRCKSRKERPAENT